MTDEIAKKARAEYDAARDAGDPAWPDLAEYRRALWRELIPGNAGVAVD